ncbi:MAG: SAM-dependent chlorinase/fluorinase [Chloroflexi bacterium]|nr:SAM-dependent chlorinase/fluorinase [Chloroflexota bacterium]
MANPIITLTSDFGSSDGFPAAMKAAILSRVSDVTLVDVTHDVPPQDVAHGSFVLGTVARGFPAGTIHCAVVDPGVGSERAAIVAAGPDGQVYVGPDNGIFTHAVSPTSGVSPGASHDRPFLAPYRTAIPEGWLAWSIDTASVISSGEVSRTFHGRDLFAPVAALLAGGASPAEIGEPVGEMTLLNLPGPRRRDDGLVGRVQYIDRFGNAATDIASDAVPPGHFHAQAGSRALSGLSESYASAQGAGCIVASHGFLEIFVTGGSAAEELGLSVGDEVALRV